MFVANCYHNISYHLNMVWKWKHCSSLQYNVCVCQILEYCTINIELPLYGIAGYIHPTIIFSYKMHTFLALDTGQLSLLFMIFFCFVFFSISFFLNFFFFIFFLCIIFSSLNLVGVILEYIFILYTYNYIIRTKTQISHTQQAAALSTIYIYKDVQ